MAHRNRWFTYWKLWFSMAMLDNQMVFAKVIPCGFSSGLPTSTPELLRVYLWSSTYLGAPHQENRSISPDDEGSITIFIHRAMTRLMIALDEKWMSMGISTSEWIESVDSSRVWKRLPNLVLHHHFPIIFPSFVHFIIMNHSKLP